MSIDLDKPVSTPAQIAALLPTQTLTKSPTPFEGTPEPPEYVMEKIKGTVLIKNQDSTAPEEAEEEETVEGGDEIITKNNSEVSLTLDENTMFHLGPNSDVKVSQLLWNNSNGFISRLELRAGKILSEVEKLAQSDSTFEVNSGGVVCGVRGTAFEVQNQEGTVHMSTFHGVVEMKKGALVQRVNANEHSAFLIKRGAFLPNRVLKPAERSHYKVWLKQKAMVQERFRQRQTLHQSMNRLTPEERSLVLQKMGQAKSRNRLKIMRQELGKNRVESLNIGKKALLKPGKKEPLQERPRSLQRARPNPKPNSFQSRPNQKHQPGKNRPLQGLKKRQVQKSLSRKLQNPPNRYQGQPQLQKHPNGTLSTPRKPLQTQKNKQQPKNKQKPDNKKKREEENKNR